MKKHCKFTKIFDPKCWLFDFAKVTGALPVLLDLRMKKLYLNGKKPKGIFRGKYVVSCNHRSYRDPVIICNVLSSRRTSFLTTKEVFANKFVSWLLKWLGAIKIDRDDTSVNVFKKAKDVLERGHVVTVFPEARVCREDDIQDFKSGVALMAAICEAPILPIYLPRRTKWYKRQIAVIGNKIDYKQLIKGNYPTLDEIKLITLKVKEEELKLQKYYEEWLNKKKKKGKNTMNKKFNTQYIDEMLANPVLKELSDFKNVTDLLEHVCKKQYANEPAVAKNDGTTATFADLYNDAQKVAQSLKDCNGHIGILAPNSYEFEVTALGIMASGKTAVCLPAALKPEQVTGLCHNLDIKVLCYHKALEANTSLAKVEKKEIGSLLQTEVKGDNFKHDIKDKDPAVILLTGGTTGIPKGVVLSHTAIMRGMMNGCYGLTKIFKQRYYCMIPLTHSFGFVRNMLTAIYTGSCIYYNQDKMALFKELPAYKPTVLILVPAIAELFLGLAKAHSVQMLGGQVHTIICGSANVPPYLSLEYDKLGIGFYPGYGMTEFANIVTGNVAPTKFPQSVGPIFPEQEAKIVDGELWLKGRNMMNGYYKNETANKEALVDGWFRTGDLAKFDEYGNLYIVGRIKDLIVLDNGEKVSPAYLEARVLKIDLVKDALVYAQRNENNVLNLVLEVTLRENLAKSIANPQEYLDKEIAKINEQSQEYEKIAKVIIRDKDFERTPAMKIIRKRG